jgi:transcriptional regulator GlxA family with amidase domain
VWSTADSVRSSLDQAVSAINDFTLIALPGSFATGMAVSLDILTTASRLASTVDAPTVRWRVCSVHGGPVRCEPGVTFDTTGLPRRSRSDRSTWVIPGLGLDSRHAVLDALADAEVRHVIAAVARHVRQGGTIASSCSAVFLLAEAGVLDGRSATTSWWLAPTMAMSYPRITVAPDRLVCVDGPITTAGAAMAQTDLMLHLLCERAGVALADRVGRTLVLDARQAQAPYVVPEMAASGDQLVRRLVSVVEASLPDVATMNVLAETLGMSERSLARHIVQATGRPPSILVQQVRLNRARHLLERSDLSVEQVAAAVGYTDATALRRLVKRMSGASPRQLRSARAVTGPPALPGGIRPKVVGSGA